MAPARTLLSSPHLYGLMSHTSSTSNRLWVREFFEDHPLLKQRSQEAFAGTGVYMKPYMAIQGNVHTIYSHVWFSCIMTCVTGEGQKTSSVLNRALSRIEKEFWQRQVQLVWPKLKRRMQVLLSVETEETQLGSLGDQVSSYLYYSGYTEPSTAKATQNTPIVWIWVTTSRLGPVFILASQRHSTVWPRDMWPIGMCLTSARESPFQNENSLDHFTFRACASTCAPFL